MNAARWRALTRAWPGMCLVAAAMHAGSGLAHESPTPSASVVQRGAGHYVLTLHFDVAEALRRTLQPAVPAARFQVQFAAMGAEDFAAAWARATEAWARACQLDAAAQPQGAQRWRWPSAKEAQAHVRERLMHGLTAPQAASRAPAVARGPEASAGHEGHVLAQAQAEFRIAGAASAAPRLMLHPALRPLSLSSWRPHPQWVGTGNEPITLRF